MWLALIIIVIGFVLYSKWKKNIAENTHPGSSPVEAVQNRENSDQPPEVDINDVIHFIRVNADEDAEYQFQLGLMYATGQGPYGHGEFTQDIEQAKYWLSKSAKQGNADAQNSLGVLYGREGEYERAVKLYVMAAKQNHIEGIVNLAMAFSMGEGVPEDSEKAHALFLKAANLENPYAQYIVGLHYFYGNSVENNPEEAFKWYWRAAKQGECHAQFEIGKGFEITGDAEEAKQWYAKAAAQGHEEAKQKLNEL